MAAAVPVLTVAAAGTQAVSSIMQGNAASNAAEAQARNAEEAAALSRAAAVDDARNTRVIGAKAMGSMQAGYSASGIKTDQGSVLDVLADSSANIERDAQRVILRGEIAARGYQDQAGLDRIKGSAASTAGYMGAASSLLYGGAAVAKYA
jgi:hypothetical protein